MPANDVTCWSICVNALHDGFDYAWSILVLQEYGRMRKIRFVIMYGLITAPVWLSSQWAGDLRAKHLGWIVWVAPVVAWGLVFLALAWHGTRKSFALRSTRDAHVRRLERHLAEGVRLRTQVILHNGNLSQPTFPALHQEAMTWHRETNELARGRDPYVTRHGDSLSALVFVPFTDALSEWTREMVPVLDNQCAKLAVAIGELRASAEPAR